MLIFGFDVKLPIVSFVAIIVILEILLSSALNYSEIISDSDSYSLLE